MIYLGFSARLLFAAVFLIAAIRKAHKPAAFVQTIRSIGFQAYFAPAIAWIVIIYEAILALAFILGVFPLLATLAALLLLAIFVSTSVYAIRSSRLILCSCFGEAETPLDFQTLLRAILLAIPVGVYYLSVHNMVTIWWPTNISIWINLLSFALALLLLARWLFAANLLQTLIRERKNDEDLLGKRHEQIIIERLRRQGASL